MWNFLIKKYAFGSCFKMIKYWQAGYLHQLIVLYLGLALLALCSAFCTSLEWALGVGTNLLLGCPSLPHYCRPQSLLVFFVSSLRIESCFCDSRKYMYALPKNNYSVLKNKVKIFYNKYNLRLIKKYGLPEGQCWVWASVASQSSVYVCYTRHCPRVVCNVHCHPQGNIFGQNYL